MDTIKIVDKLTLRQEALRMAVMQAVDNDSVNHICGMAEKFESYLRGDVKLPEYEDAHKDFKEMLGKLQESFKPNPWISADDEMKPAKGVEAVCALRYGSKFEKALMVYDHEEKKWYDGDDDSNTNHVVAWMPIPTYIAPSKL